MEKIPIDTSKERKAILEMIANIDKIRKKLSTEGLMNEAYYINKAIKELKRALRSL